MRVRRVPLMLRTRLRYHLARTRNPRSGLTLLRRFMDISYKDTHVENSDDRRSPEVANGNHPAPESQAPQAGTQPSAKPPRLILLVRHGQTTYNVEQRLPGQLPGVPLTEEGRRQAHQAAVALAAIPLSAVISSPLERARDTAAILARGWGIAVREDPRLMDTNVERWAGKKIDEVSKEDPAWKAYLDNPLAPPEGVESFASVQDRAAAVVEDVLRDPSLGNYVVLVAHADVVKLIIARYTGVPILGARFLAVGNASLSALAFSENDPPHLLAMNWTSAPGWLVPPLPRPQQQPLTTGGVSASGASSESSDGAATSLAAPSKSSNPAHTSEQAPA